MYAFLRQHYNLCTSLTSDYIDDWDSTSFVHLYIIVTIVYLYIVAMTVLTTVLVLLYAIALVFSTKEEEEGHRGTSDALRSKVVREMIFPIETLSSSAKSSMSQQQHHCRAATDANATATAQQDNDDLGCPICLEHFSEEGDGIATISLCCSHTFHRDCIIEWSEQRKSHCPVCRQAMWKSERFDALLQSAKKLQQEEEEPAAWCAAMMGN